MNRNSLFTEHQDLMMHLSAIGSVGVKSSSVTPELPFKEQRVEEITVEKVDVVDQETILLIKDSFFDIGTVDFKKGQVILVPIGKQFNEPKADTEQTAKFLGQR